MKPGGFLKPEYLLKPQNMLARLRYRDPDNLPQPMTVDLHGAPFRIYPREVISRHILHFGLFDLLVTEALMRLAEPGETALDVGANIGYMARVLAEAVGPAGRVHAFEPHPAIYEDLVANTAGLPVATRQAAVSDSVGEAQLHIPANFKGNRGVASLERSEYPTETIAVPCVVLDELFAAEDTQIGVLKIDIEGHELPALRGAARLLEGKRIRDVVFEEHKVHDSPTADYLASHGYRIFRLYKHFGGAELIDPQREVRESTWESPSFLATADADRAQRAFAQRGWKALRA